MTRPQISRMSRIRQPRNFEIFAFIWNRGTEIASFVHGVDPVSETGHSSLGFGALPHLCRRDGTRFWLWHGLSRLANLLGLPDSADERRSGGFR
jgi:hypothetical protein